MHAKLPLTLWRYILVELWRLILLTAAVLVTVIAFAAAVKPLADGKLTPTEALKFMALATIPMLQYALPFAAGFGATLAYHRLSTDNEVVGAHAGGVGHRGVLMPAVLSGLVLAGVLLGLNQVVMPPLLKSMERLLTRDVTKILLNSFSRGEAIPVIDKVMVYADKAVPLDVSPTSGARAEMALWGVAAIELNKNGDPVKDVTTTDARLWVYDDQSQTNAQGAAALVTVRTGETMTGDGRGNFTRARDVPITLRAEGAFKDDPKFLTFHELRELRKFPERMNWIEQRRYDLAVHLGERAVTEAIDRGLRTAGEIALIDEDGGTIVVRGSGVMLRDKYRWVVEPPTRGGTTADSVEVVLRTPSGAPASVLHAGALAFCTDLGGRDRANRRLTLRIEAEHVTGTTGRVVPAEGTQDVWKRVGLRLANNPLDELADVRMSPSPVLLNAARARAEDPAHPDTFVASPYRDLRDSLAKLNREITSKQHERFAMAAACLVMVVAGAMTSLRLGTALPLTVYLWSFFPALATVISISSGQQLTHDAGAPGLIVLWGGVAALGAYAAWVYSKVARH